MTEPPFSRPVRVEPLPRGGFVETVEATPEERAALARLNNLPDIARLTARLDLSKSGRGVRVEGMLSARLTQLCVVSLEPFEVEIEEPIDVRFLPSDGKSPSPDDLGDADAPDPIVDGRIDLGGLVGEFLTLALDPYPRKPGAAFAPPPDDAEEAKPFDALRALSDREEPD